MSVNLTLISSFHHIDEIVLKIELKKDFMRIILFLPSLRGGGAERSGLYLANEFAHKGHEVFLVLGQNVGPYQAMVSPFVTIVDLKLSRVSQSILPLARILRNIKPDLLLSFMNYANIIAGFAWILSGKKCGFYPSERTIFSKSLQGKSLLWTKVFKFLTAFVYNRSNSVIGISRGVVNDLKKSVRVQCGKLHYIYNPVLLDDFELVERQPINEPWLLDVSKFCFISAGRLVESKDFSMLLRAFHEFLQREQGYLIILGDGERREALWCECMELGIDQNVKFVGFVSDPMAYFYKSDAFCFASRYEGFGNVLVEALACGIPVVSTDCPSGPREILDHGKYGRLVPVGDHMAMARAMIEIKAKGGGKHSIERAKEFSVSRIADQYLDLFKSKENG